MTTPGRQAAIEAAAKDWYERVRQVKGWAQVGNGWRNEWLARTEPIIDAYERALAEQPREPRIEQVRAEQIEQGDRLWIEYEHEWYPVARVVVRDADVLLWLEDVDEPWDELRRDQTMWRLRPAEQPREER